MISSLPTGWDSVLFRDSLAETRTTRRRKIQAREYVQAGTFPVVDQGQKFVAGYTDDTEAVIREGLPYVVFGDHTRTFKFVDFPFALGADGTQLLKPSDAFDPRFFAFACQHLQIPNRGYNRHFVLVKEMPLPRPPLREQQRIAALLSLVQGAIENEVKAIEASHELKRAVMTRLFRGAEGASTRHETLGVIPAHWVRVRVADLGGIVTGTTPSTANREYYEGGAIPFFAPGDLGETTRIRRAAKHITQAGLRVSRAIPRDSVCVVCIGSTIGKVGITVDDLAVTNQQINAITPSDRFDPLFVCYLLQYFADEIASHASPSPVPIMSKGIFQQIELVAPSDRTEQRSIAHIVETTDQAIEIRERRRVRLTELFTTLLGKLMTGEIRVDRIKIDTSSVVVT